MNTEISDKLDNEIETKSIRDKICKFEDLLNTIPGSFRDDNEICPLKHTFADGIYVREIFIPKGMLIVGKIHKHKHPNFLLSGEVLVITEEGGREHLKAPLSLISSAGTKRVVYAIEDSVWVTIHENHENITDLEKLEDFIIAKTYEEYDNFKKLQIDEFEKKVVII